MGGEEFICFTHVAIYWGGGGWGGGGGWEQGRETGILR